MDITTAAHVDREERIALLRRELIGKSAKMQGDREWRDALIESACYFKELAMLEFFHRLMTETNGPDLLRVIHGYAKKYGVAPDDITPDIADAFRMLTAGNNREFNVVVTGTTRPNSDLLIKAIITDPVSASKLICFITERGNNDPETLIDFLEKSKSTPAPLTPGSL